MKISVLINSYNGERFIEKSVKSVLSQSFKDFEIVFIDDGSTDNTEQVVKKLQEQDSHLKYYKSAKNLGIRRIQDKGLRLCQGEYVAKLDVDDEWIDNTKLAKQVDFLDNNKNCVLVGTNVNHVTSEGKIISKTKYSNNPKKIKENILRISPCNHSSVLYRKDIALLCGGYINSDMASDYDLYLRMAQEGDINNLEDYTVNYYVFPNSYSHKNPLNAIKEGIRLSNFYSKFYPKALRAKITNFIKLSFCVLFGTNTYHYFKNSIKNILFN